MFTCFAYPIFYLLRFDVAQLYGSGANGATTTQPASQPASPAGAKEPLGRDCFLPSAVIACYSECLYNFHFNLPECNIDQLLVRMRQMDWNGPLCNGWVNVKLFGKRCYFSLSLGWESRARNAKFYETVNSSSPHQKHPTR